MTASAIAQQGWTQADTHAIEWRHNVRAARLTPAQMARLKKITGSELQACSDDELPREAKVGLADFPIEPATLAPDKSGFAVQGMGSCMCGAVGNCPFWLLDSDMHLLIASRAQEFALLPQLKNGMRNVVLRLHGSATDSSWALYQFDGKHYRPSQCADVNYSPNPDRILKRPKVTPQRCDEWKE